MLIVEHLSNLLKGSVKPSKSYLGLQHILPMGDDIDETYTKAMSDIDSKKWQEAMKSEMDSLYANQVWTLVDISEGVVPIENKWIFKRKKGFDGKVETYKARLVAKGYKQREGIDYEETFSLVMIKSIRILLAIAAYYDRWI